MDNSALDPDIEAVPSGRHIYDVTLSWNSEGPNLPFFDTLFDALVRSGLRTFKDDGVSKSDVQKAREQSLISIIILSEDLEDSGQELETIIESSSRFNYLVLPVFYDVYPYERLYHNKEAGVGSSKQRLFPGISDLMALVLPKDSVNEPKCIQSFVGFIQDGIKKNQLSFWASKVCHLKDSGLSKLPNNIKFPLLKVLFLQDNGCLLTIPDSFFMFMPTLQVLDMSRTSIKHLPPSISNLVCLQKLVLRECALLRKLPPEIKDLKNLEIFDLSGTELIYIPKEIIELYKLECLRMSLSAYAYEYLTGINEDLEVDEKIEIIPRHTLSALSNLKELSIFVDLNCKWWGVLLESIILELGLLNRLKMLTLYFPTIHPLQKLLQHQDFYQNLSNFRLVVGRGEQRVISRHIPQELQDQFETLGKCLKYVNGREDINEVAKACKYARTLFIDRHWTINTLSQFKDSVKNIMFCMLIECNQLETVINGHDVFPGDDNEDEFDAEKPVLGVLQYLSIHYMKSLNSISVGPIPSGSLNKLQILALNACSNMDLIFDVDLLHNLISLKELIVEDCPNIESIVSVKSSYPEQPGVVFLPCLEMITLLYLPKLASISKSVRIAPKLAIMVVYHCPKLESLPEGIYGEHLKEIKGERGWWNTLKGERDQLGIFVPLEGDGLMSQLAEARTSYNTLSTMHDSYINQEPDKELEVKEAGELIKAKEDVTTTIERASQIDNLAGKNLTEPEKELEVKEAGELIIAKEEVTTTTERASQIYNLAGKNLTEREKELEVKEAGELIIAKEDVTTTTERASQIYNLAGKNLKMDGTGFEGAIVGAAFSELLKVVVDVLKTTYLFKSRLQNIYETLDSIRPVINEIVGFNTLLEQKGTDTNTFVKKMEFGRKLILKCSKISPRNVVKKYIYSKKLATFDKLLLQFRQVPVQGILASTSTKSLVGVDVIEDKLDILLSKLPILENGGGGSYCNVPGLPDLIIGLDEPLKDLKKMIMNEGVSQVVLSAPAGTGKTTLSKMLCNDEIIQGTYGENIFFVTVSQKARLEDIVHEILQLTGTPIPEFLNNDDVMNQLERLMERLVQNGPILLVLDDVWSEWDSNIQKFNFTIPDFKILITSRFVFPNFDHTYKLCILSEKDSTTLFCHFALTKYDHSEIPEELIKEVVKDCGGSPLVLTVVGRLLYDQPSVIWRHTLQKLSTGNSSFPSKQQELRLLTSLDVFFENDILKECFLDLGFFPEYQNITASILLDMWIESYGQDDDHALKILRDLCFRKLLNLSPLRKDAIKVDGYCNERYVTQHTLLRDFAIHLSNQEPIQHRKRLFLDFRGYNDPKWSIVQQQQLNSVRLLSISTDRDFESAWDNIQLPTTEVLILNFKSEYYVLPLFIKEMNKLKVLIITNSGSFSAELIHFQLLKYLHSLKRIHFEHVSIPSLLILLKNLQKVSLMMCQISKAFDSCTSGTPNIFPNLTELNIDYCDDIFEFPVGLCKLSKLKKFRISYCSNLIDLPDQFGQLENLEMLIIVSCTEFLYLPESICDLYNLSFLDISGCIRMIRMPEKIGMLKNLKVLRMRDCDGIQVLPKSVGDLSGLKNVLCNEEILHLWKVYKDQISHLDISVAKEDVNLDWLHSA